jgi:dTDP-4-amino-4,6-dideoxygalactose transaminase
VCRGTGAGIFYSSSLNELPILKEILQDKQFYPNSEKLSGNLVTLPVHPGMSPSHRQKIVNLIERELIS